MTDVRREIKEMLAGGRGGAIVNLASIAGLIIARAITLGQYDEEAIIAMHPIGRMGRPNEIAEGIHWLLSDKASPAG